MCVRCLLWMSLLLAHWADAQSSGTAHDPNCVARLEGSGGRIAEISDDGAKLLTANERILRVWEVGSGRPLTDAFRYDSPIEAAHWVAGSKRFIVAGGHEVRIYDVASLMIVTHCTQKDSVTDAVISPNGKWVITTTKAGGGTIWDVSAGRTDPVPPEKTPLFWASFSSDSTKFLAFNYDIQDRLAGKGVIHLRATVGTRDLIPPIKTSYAGSGLSPAELSRDGKLLVISQSKHFEIYRVDGFEKLSQKTSGDDFGVDAGYGEIVHFMPDGQQVLWVTDVSAQTFSTSSGEPVGSLVHVIVGGRGDVGIKNNMLLVPGTPKNAGVWDLGTGRRRQVLGSLPVTCVAMAPDGEHACVGRLYQPLEQDGFTEIWRISPDQRHR